MAINAGQVCAYLELDTGQFAAGINTAVSMLGELRNNSLSATQKLALLGDGMQSAGKTLTTAVTTSVAALGTLSVKTFTGFDDAMKQVQATMVAGEEDMAKLTATAKQMGTDTRYSASEAAEALNYLALAGYNADQACESLPKVLALAQAGGMELAYASDLATDAMSALGLGIDDLTTFTDQMARTAQKSNTSVSQLGEAILTVGGTARQLAGGTVELNTQLGILADNGIKGAEGGTTLRNVILSLTAPTDQAAALMEQLGLKCYDANGDLRGTEEIFRDLNAALSTMSGQERSEVLSTLFNKVDLKGVEALLANCTDRYAELSNEIENSAGATQAMADTMESGIGGAFRSLSSAAEGAAIAFGEALAPTVQTVAEMLTGLTRAFAGLPESTQQTIAKIALMAAAIGPVLLAGGKLISMGASIVAVMSGPAGWITLGIAGIAALTAGAADLVHLVQKIDSMDTQKKWQELLAGADEDVERSMTATINAELDANIDTSRARSAIETAIGELETALSGFGLSKDQIAAIQGMIGQDYDAIYARCLDFGLSEEQAGQIAAQVEGMSGLIARKLDGLSIAMTPAQAVTMIGEAAGNKAQLIEACRAMGLTDADIEQLGGVFDEMNGRVADRIPNLLQTIADKLTDGEADTPETVDGLKSAVQAAFDTALADVDLWESLELDKLDPNAPDFATACESIKATAAETRTELETLRTETSAFVGDMAGKSTAEVAAHLEELDAIEARVDQVLGKIGQAQTSAREVGNAQYELTAAGATLDSNTVAQGVQWAYQNYKLDVAAIEEAAAQAKAEADQAWQDGLMTDSEHLEAEQAIDAQLADQNAAVLETYRSRMNELLTGIYDAYATLEPGGAQTVARLAELFSAREALDSAVAALDAGVDDGQRAALRARIQDLADSLFPEEGWEIPEGFEMIKAQQLIDAIDAPMAETMAAFEGGNNPLVTLLNGIAESGATAPLELDLTNFETAVTACMGQAGTAGGEAYAGALTDASDAAQSAGGSLGDSGASGAGTATGSYTAKGRDAGQGYANGIRSKIRTVREAAAALAREGASALAQAQNSNSPAKLHMGLGHDAGDGYVLGIRDRIPAAKSAAADLVNLSMAKPAAIDISAETRRTAAGGAMASSGKIEINIANMQVRQESDIRRISSQLAQYIASANYM